MNEVYNIIYKILKKALFQEKIYLPKMIDWSQVLDEMRQQTVEGLGFGEIKDLLPLEVREQWNNIVLRKVASWLQMMEEQQLVVNTLRSHGTPFVVLKGTAASMYYPKPEYRSMGDIDLLVTPDCFQNACETLKNMGYQVRKDTNEKEHHAEFLKGNMMVEIHHRFNSGKGTQKSEYLSQILYDGLKKAEWKTIEKYEFPVLPCLQNGLVLLQHIANHLRGGLGLRQIMDWMMFVSKEMDNKLWEELLPILQELQLETLAVTVSGMCRKYFDLDNVAWCPAWDESLVDELMEYVILKGNFGRKATTTEQGMGIFASKSILGFLKSLQGKGEYHWSAYKKHPWLRPFAWFYQICRYIKLGLVRKNPLKSIQKDYETVQQRNDFFKRLGVSSEE